MPASLGGGGAAHGLGRRGRQRGQNAKRFLVAALAEHGHGIQLIGLRGIGLAQHDGGPGLRQGQLQPRVLLPRQRLLEHGEDAGFARMEDRLGRFLPLDRVRAQQGEPAHGRLDGTPDAVVDPHGLQAGGRDIRRSHGAGRSLDQAAIVGLDVGLLLGRLDQQPAVGERLQDRQRPRAAAGGEPADAGLDILELGRRDFRQHVVDRLGSSAGHRSQQAEQNGSDRGAWRGSRADDGCRRRLGARPPPAGVQQGRGRASCRRYRRTCRS